jgi:hypothetical protein
MPMDQPIVGGPGDPGGPEEAAVEGAVQADDAAPETPPEAPAEEAGAQP